MGGDNVLEIHSNHLCCSLLLHSYIPALIQHKDCSQTRASSSSLLYICQLVWGHQVSKTSELQSQSIQQTLQAAAVLSKALHGDDQGHNSQSFLKNPGKEIYLDCSYLGQNILLCVSVIVWSTISVNTLHKALQLKSHNSHFVNQTKWNQHHLSALVKINTFS